MKKFHGGLTAFLLAGLLGLLLAGCGSDSAPLVSNETEELNLTDEFGGYKASDQPPGFGDPEIISSMTEDESAPVFAGDSVDTATLYGNPRFTLYTVTVRWGQLAGDSTISTATDWSGSASLVRGHLRLLRKIRFERAQDSIVRPRSGPLEIGWVSQTTVHFDGLIFLIADPVDPNDDLAVESSFTFSTEPYTATFSLAELANLDTVINVDDLGNEVAISAHLLQPDPCAKGFMEGVWWPNNHLNKMGKYHGKWVSGDGSLAGHVRGHWGERGNGERVLFGQWIDLSGVFKGFLRGTWERDAENPGQGFIRGTIFTRNKTEIGKFRGNYILPNDDHSSGFFHAGWALNCPEEETEP